MQMPAQGDAISSASLVQDRVPHFTFVATDGSEENLFPERESGRIHAIAGCLKDQIPRGSPIGLLYRSEPNLVLNWLACVLAGLQPLILQYPTRKQNRKYWSDSIADTTVTVGLSAILSDDYCASLGIDAIARVIHQRELDILAPVAPGPVLPDAFDIIQLSSGTTGHRKALRYASRELARHVAAYNAALALTSDDRIVSWLPLYHDMGYVACFVMPLLLGIDIIMMDPMSWVQRPELLFDAIQRHRGTICYMPNFGYEVMARLAPRTLPSMRRWVSSSEPISAITSRKFLRTIGADPGIFAPAYAMAENVFAIAIGQGCSTVSIDGVDVVSCGRPIPGVEVKTIDGELWVRSPTMPPTYLDGKDIRDADGFYATGDMGRLIDGGVYVTGRKRDVLIQAGRKFLLSDIDLRLNELRPEIRGRAAALAIHDERLGTEIPTILIEAPNFFRRTDAAEIATELKEATGLDQLEVVFVPPRFLTKTSSGKINRRISSANWLAVREAQKESRSGRSDPASELRASFWSVAWDQPISDVLDSLSRVILGIALDGTHVRYERHWSLNDIVAALEAEVTVEQPSVRDTIRIVSLADYGTIWHVSEGHLDRLEDMLGCKVTFEHVCVPPSAITLSDLIFHDYFQPRIDQAPFAFVDRVLAKLKDASILLMDDVAELVLLDGATFGALSHNFERDPRADLICVRWQEYAKNHDKLPLTVVPGSEIPYSASTTTIAQLSSYLNVPIFRIANEQRFADYTEGWDYRPLRGGVVDPDEFITRLADWLRNQDVLSLQRTAQPGPKLVLLDLPHFCSQSVRKSALDLVLGSFDSFCVAGLPCSVPYLRTELERLGKRHVRIPSYGPEIFGALTEQYDCLLSCGAFGDVTPDIPVVTLMHVGSEPSRIRNAPHLANIADSLNEVPTNGGSDWYCAFDLPEQRDNIAAETPPQRPSGRKRFIEQLAAQGLVVSDEPDFHLVIDGRPIHPSRVDGKVYRFELPGDLHDLRVVSRCHVPSFANPDNDDMRRLGVCLSSIVLHADGVTREIALSDPALGEGFHPLESNGEATWRWTDGDARLPVALLDRAAASSACLEIKLLWPGAYWIPAEQAPVAHATANEPQLQLR